MQDPNFIKAADLSGVPSSPAPPLASSDAAVAAAEGKPRLTPERRGLYMARTQGELLHDVARLADQQYDMSGRLLQERDEQNRILLDAQSSLRWAKGLIKLLSAAIVGSWAVTALLIKLWLLPILEKVPR
jgi:hypothetical protein